MARDIIKNIVTPNGDAMVDETNDALRVNVVAGGSTTLPTGAATSAKQDTGNTSLASIDGKITAVNTGAVVIASGTTTVTQATGTNLHTVVDSGTISTITNVVHVDDNSGSLTVDNGGTFAVQSAQSGTWTIQPGNTANTTAWKVDGSAVTQPVSLASVPSHAVTNTGTFAVQATISGNQAVNVAQVAGTNTVTGGVSGTLGVGGNVATNVAIGTNPINLGAQAVSAENTAVTATRMAQLVTDLVGKLIVLPYANPENFVSGAITSAMTGTTSTSLIAAPASGLRNYITQITVSNSHATVGTDVIIQDGNGGTTLYTIPAAAAYGGAVIVFPTPLKQPTTATAIYCANVTTGSSIKVSASGYKGI